MGELSLKLSDQATHDLEAIALRLGRTGDGAALYVFTTGLDQTALEFRRLDEALTIAEKRAP